MKIREMFFATTVMLLMISSCATHKIEAFMPSSKSATEGLVDKNATAGTKALFINLKKLSSENKTMFGQQDATWYGINADGSLWKDYKDRSDVKSVTGSHPALYGWDLQGIVPAKMGFKHSNPLEPDTIKMLVTEAYERGGVNTFSWHMHNPVTMKNMYDTTPALATLLPGQKNHAHYKQCLDKIAEFFSSLKGKNGELIPVIFRPFHEHNGNWFWWCKPFCTPQEYKQLIQFTVKYLRDVKGVHNVLYAYSTDKIQDWADYKERYAGDDYYDILGMDNYWEFKDLKSAPKAIKSLRMVVQYALDKNKVPALTETGLERITNPNWYTTVLWNSIEADSVTKKIAYLLVWRNGHLGHFFTPYPGHNSVPDFLRFYNDPHTVFQNDLPDMYKVDEKGK